MLHLPLISCPYEPLKKLARGSYDLKVAENCRVGISREVVGLCFVYFVPIKGESPRIQVDTIGFKLRYLSTTKTVVGEKT
jgi:hypothetical protein